VIERLSGERRLIAPDLRGLGWTDAPPGPIDPDVFVRDTIALLDALGIERTDLAGHDWGGFTSLLLAARHPERLRKVVAFSTPHPWVQITPRLALETWRAWYAVALAAGLAERSTKLANWFMGREGFDPTPYTDRLRDPSRAAATTRLYRSYLRTLGDTVRRRAEERRVGVPTLLTIGAKDQAVTPRLGEGFQNFEVLPQAGHFVCDTHADAVTGRIRGFLT
jgi:pimeloyl-ACP methyl ester carboxylesterase